MTEPIAVLISDIHYNINTLELADAALRQALRKVEELSVPLIIAGDLLDNKAIIRAECANALLETLCNSYLSVYILVGNHDKINVKGTEHSLNFLNNLSATYDKDYRITEVINDLQRFAYNNVYMLPYYDNPAEFKENLFKIPKGSIVICHQGVMGAEMGTYAVDNSSVDPAELKDYRIISGHYHKHQTVGTVTYIGNPYTLSFAEANDGPKGFQILNDDGSLTFVPTNLRKHVIFEATINENDLVFDKNKSCNGNDLIWIKLRGTKSQLDSIDKKYLEDKMALYDSNFKLDKIYIDNTPLKADASKLSGEELFDQLIDNTTESIDRKEYLKKLWRQLV